MPPALEILALDTATPQIRAPGSGDTYAAPRALAVTANPANTSLIAGSGYSLTGSDSTPMLDFSGNWATTGTPTALRLNIATDTGPSNAASNLLDLQVGGVSRFRVTKTGAGVFGGTQITWGANGEGYLIVVSTQVVRCIPNNYWNLGGIPYALGANSLNPDVFIDRDAAHTLALRRTTNAQTFRVYNTFTAADNFERGKIEWASNVLRIGTEKGTVGGTARAIAFQTDGVTRLEIEASGANAGVIIPPASRLRFTNDTVRILRESDGLRFDSFSNINIVWSGSGNRLNLGGTTSSFPALKRDSAALVVRLADDSANAALESASVKTDAPAGGTSGTWKLGVAATVTPTSPNRTIEVDIGGTIYYIHAKTTND
jgi:hypothetical protein